MICSRVICFQGTETNVARPAVICVQQRARQRRDLEGLPAIAYQRGLCEDKGKGIMRAEMAFS